MRGNYNFEHEAERHFWKVFIETKIEYLINNINTIDDIDLSNVDICPYQLYQLLEEDLGYERTNSDMNGWEQDTWCYFYNEKKDLAICVFSCGMTFELKLLYNGKEE